MSRISVRIEKSGWSFGVLRDSLRVIGEYLQLPWNDRIEELVKADETSEERQYIERILDHLFRKGDTLLKQVRALSASSHDLTMKVSAVESENQSFAREMCGIRRSVAKLLVDMGYKFSQGLGVLDVYIDDMWSMLAARNAAPNQPLMEENLNSPVSPREQECARVIQEYVIAVGWSNLPLGEKEEALLCLCQHLYSMGEFSAASSLFVDAIESGFQDPLIYYNYFVLGVSVGEFEAAMEGYRVACQALPMLSLAPSDRYQIELILGKDRIATSFVGKDTYEKQPVMLKILHNPSPTIRKAVLEVRKKLKHSGIAEIYDFMELNKVRPCVAMEYLEGPSMAQRIKEKGAIPADQWLQLALQVTGALAYAHDQGIAHGNITPSKLVMHKGEIKIIDFCLSPFEQWPVPLTKNDLADIYFVAPEIIMGGAPQLTSDIYSLGKTLYYLLTAKIPHQMYQETMPNVIWPILRKATDLDPQVRHQNATQLLAELAQASAAPLSIPAQPQMGNITSGVSRTRIVPIETGGTVLLPEKFAYRDGVIISQFDDAQMVLVPESIFTMGSTEKASESPIHEIYLGHYLIDKYPVTNAQYARFLDYIHKSGDHSKCHPEEPQHKDHTPRGWQTPDYKKYSDQDNCPVIFVDFWDAWAYASWAGKSLPTEAQWEKSARGVDGRKYPWGDEEPTINLANFGNNLGKTSVVGSFPQGVSPTGCMDMAGNVWGWCLDAFDKDFYRSHPRENPICTINRPSRVLRGGSWNDAATALRAASRGSWIQTVRYAYIGFRCVRVL